MSEPSFFPCCSNPAFIWILLLHIFLPYTNLELLMSLLPLFSLFNLPTGSHAVLAKLSVLFSIWKHFQIRVSYRVGPAAGAKTKSPWEGQTFQN